MNTLFFLNQVALGISQAHHVNRALEDEASIRQGRNHHFAAQIQTAQLNRVLSQFLGLLDFSGIPITNPLILTKNIVAFSPSLLAYLAARKNLGLRTRKLLNFVQDHYVTVSLAVSTVTTVAFFAMGHTIYGATTVVFLGLGLLDRKGYLPPRIRAIIYQSGTLLSDVTGILYSDSLTKCLCLINLVGNAIDGFLYIKNHKQNKISPHPNIPPTQVTLSVLDNLKKGNLLTQINRSHVNIPFLPPLKPGVKLNQLIDFSEMIDWDKHQHVLLKKLESDPRWTEVGILGKEKPIDYFKKCLHSFVKSVEKRNIIHGQPLNYDQLEQYCLIITQELATQDEITIVDILLEIGVGGEYCGSGKFRIIEERVGLIIQNIEGYPLDKRILACLQGMRITKWNSIYDSIWKSSPLSQLLGWYIDKNDTHVHNQYLNLSNMGKLCGLPHHGALNDRTADVPPWLEFVTANLNFQNILHKAFWENEPIQMRYFKQNKVSEKWNIFKWYSYTKEANTFTSYTLENIVSNLCDEIGKKNSIPKPLIYEWWCNWILRQNLTEEQKSELLDQLTTLKQPNLQGIQMEINGKINPIIIQAMLLEMGVFYA